MSQLYVISIGLNMVGFEPADQLTQTLQLVSGFWPIKAVSMGRGSWMGQPERFVQVVVEATPGELAMRCALLARRLHQEAIATTRYDLADDPWTLSFPDGNITPGGSRREFPIIVTV